VAVAAALAIIYAAGAFVGGIPYPPGTVAATIIRLTPGDVATALIERLQHLAMILLGLFVHAGALAIGSFAGAFVHRSEIPRTRARKALVAAAVLFGVAAALGALGSDALSLSAIAVYAAAAVGFARIVNEGPLMAALEPALRDGGTPLDAILNSRRRFVVRGIAIVGGALLGGFGVFRFFSRKKGPNVSIAHAAEPFTRPPEDEAFPKVPGITPEITDNDSFYTVDINPFTKPSVDHESWRLEVGGLLERPYSLSYRSLQTEFEVIEMVHTLTCISNEVGGDLISTAVWRGVRLKEVLDRAGIPDGVVDVVFRAAEGYSDSIPIAKALEDTTLVVFGMNGEALPRGHGFPARIIVPGIYGMKNVKWLTRIETMDRDYQGYWMVRGWSDVARVKTQSRIDVPSDRETAGDASRLGGIAWAGDRGIRRVEVSEDGGKSWRPATLKREMSKLTWRLWAADIEPGKGRHRVMVRSTDGAGEVQESDVTAPHPEGASGFDAVTFEVE
jgi:DMSO/TMAO reductase YedYZ molybdopterin-dependent catalytic subunit